MWVNSSGNTFGDCPNAKAQVAEAALEDALIRRFGPQPRVEIKLALRSDNGLIFMARSYRQMVKDYGLCQEFITPYTPEQNGVVERVFRTMKDECIWLQRFGCIAEEETAISRWIVRTIPTGLTNRSDGCHRPSGARVKNKPRSCPERGGTVHRFLHILSSFDQTLLS